MDNKRKEYRQKRRKQLQRVASLKNDMVEEDLELYYEFKPFRDRANREMDKEIC